MKKINGMKVAHQFRQFRPPCHDSLQDLIFFSTVEEGLSMDAPNRTPYGSTYAYKDFIFSSASSTFSEEIRLKKEWTLKLYDIK